MGVAASPSILLLVLLYGKHSSQFWLEAVWHPSHRRQSPMNVFIYWGGFAPVSVLPDPTRPSTSLPQSHGLFQALQLSALWVSACISASQASSWRSALWGSL